MRGQHCNQAMTLACSLAVLYYTLVATALGATPRHRHATKHPNLRLGTRPSPNLQHITQTLQLEARTLAHTHTLSLWLAQFPFSPLAIATDSSTRNAAQRSSTTSPPPPAPIPGHLVQLVKTARSGSTTGMACPFAKLSINGGEKKCPVAKTGDQPSEAMIGSEQVEGKKEGGTTGAGRCPFGFDRKKPMVEIDEPKVDVESDVKKGENAGTPVSGQCPFGYGKDKGTKENNESGSNEQSENRKEETTEAPAGGKCPLGYDSVSFKIGPFSCVLCRALLYDSSRCVPCRHIFCRGCISRFQDCPLCGLDIDSIDSDPEMQGLVDRFVEGHARTKRPSLQTGVQEASAGNIKYEDISVERGSFLVQQAMRALEGKNMESAKARLSLCVEDSREEMSRSGATSTNCSQLGALLGMLGDCCRAMQDIDGAVANYEESVELLMKLPDRDVEVVHALSVSLNKLGDLKYYAQELEAARAFYARALNVRLEATTDFTTLSSQVLDVAISLAKVADVDFALGKESAAAEGFQEALKKLENLKPPKTGEAAMLEKKRLSVMTFLQSQLPAST